MKNKYFVIGDEVVIHLYRSLFWTIIDLEDFDIANSIHTSWCNFKNRGVHTTINGRTVFLHRLILNVMDSVEVDHRNRDEFDNRRANIRLADRYINNRNRGIRKDNKSGCIGVHYSKKDGIWLARITINNKKIHLGSFYKLEDAIKARQKAEAKYF